MNAKYPLLLFLLALIGVPLLASVALAAGASGGSFLQANFIYEFASDRGRMIQASLVIVALGCALMWWYR